MLLRGVVLFVREDSCVALISRSRCFFGFVLSGCDIGCCLVFVEKPS